MTRLYDRIRAMGSANCAYAGWVDRSILDTRQLDALLANAQVIVADNVAGYYWMGSDQEYWGVEDFPNAAPPFETFLVEWRVPPALSVQPTAYISVIQPTSGTRPSSCGFSARREKPIEACGHLRRAE